MVMSQRIYWISQKCFHCYGVVDFKRPHFKILTKSQPITIIGRWASLKQTKSTFQRLPVQNNKQLGCHKLNLEPSPHIPYGENRRLEWDWGDSGISLYEGATWILDWGGAGRWLPRFAANSEEVSSGTAGTTDLRLELIAMNTWGGED